MSGNLQGKGRVTLGGLAAVAGKEAKAPGTGSRWPRTRGREGEAAGKAQAGATIERCAKCRGLICLWEGRRIGLG